MYTCKTCKFNDEFRFCEKLVVDTKRCFVENGKHIIANYISEREEDDDRSSFITPKDFGCVHYENNDYLTKEGIERQIKGYRSLMKLAQHHDEPETAEKFKKLISELKDDLKTI